MNLSRFLLCFGLFVAVVGCTTSSSMGQRVESDVAMSIEKGKTTKQDLIQKLGAPNGQSVTSEGLEIIYWNHNTFKMTFMPFGQGGNATEATNLVVTLDRKGIVQNYTYSQSSNGGKAGIGSK